jgi:hypothetical protein
LEGGTDLLAATNINWGQDHTDLRGGSLQPTPLDQAALINVVDERSAWQDHRNKHHAKADWQFTTANARVKLKRLYPQFE